MFFTSLFAMKAGLANKIVFKIVFYSHNLNIFLACEMQVYIIVASKLQSNKNKSN